MKTIVTGGAGFIGSHLVKKLIKRGRKVVVVDDLSAGSLKNLFNLGLRPSDFEFKKVDLTNYHQASEAFKKGDVVYHLAARIGGLKFLHASDSAELLALQKNLAIDSNVFRVCGEKKIKKIIYLSSSAIYHLHKQFSLGAIFSEKNFEFKPKNEEQKFKMAINPDGGYGLSKLLAEIQLNLMKNVKVGIARIFNVYGENEPFGEKAHAISDLICKAINYPNEKFVVWGDGRQTRDYIYVTDCADALIKMEEKISKTSPLILNIGSGRATSIKEIVEIVIKISGKDIQPIYNLKEPVGPISRTANINRAKKLLHWQPKVSLDKGLKRTYFWIEKELVKCKNK